MSALMYRTYGIVRGDAPTILHVAVEPADPLIAFVVVLAATGRAASVAPLRWVGVAVVMATAGVAVFAAAAWLVGRAHDGVGGFVECANTAVYIWVPIAIGGLSHTALMIGLGVSYLVATGVLRVLHAVTWGTAMIIAFVPMMLLVAGLALVT